MDELKLKVSFYAFLGSSAYLFLKRFYLNELIGLFLWGLSYLLVTFWDLFIISMSSINLPTNFDFFDFDCCPTTLASPLLMTHGPLLT